MLSLVKISSVIIVLALSACGFTPLYEDANNAQYSYDSAAGFDQIFIENIPNREGQYLRNALIDRFYSAGRPQNPAYNLNTGTLTERHIDLDVTKSSDATRAQMRLETTIVLSNPNTGQELLKRKLTSTTSYNVLQSHFTTKVSEDNARRNALDDLARQIELQLSLYFKRT